jgi:inhibitor of KinA sporulation pathway (predicted exonuclease)
MRDPSLCLVIDLEATCWKDMPPPQPNSEIIEIGIAEIDTKTKVITATESMIICPANSKISDFCTELTSITQVQVDSGITLSDACRLLRQRYNSRNCFWASYGSSDERALRRECAAKSVTYPMSHSYINVKAMVEFQFGELLGLHEALDRTGLGFQGRPHRGVDDAYNTARLLLHLLPMSGGFLVDTELPNQ